MNSTVWMRVASDVVLKDKPEIDSFERAEGMTLGAGLPAFYRFTPITYIIKNIELPSSNSDKIERKNNIKKNCSR